MGPERDKLEHWTLVKVDECYSQRLAFEQGHPWIEPAPEIASVRTYQSDQFSVRVGMMSYRRRVEPAAFQRRIRPMTLTERRLGDSRPLLSHVEVEERRPA